MATGDLTTISNVKAWLNITGTTDDANLTRMVRQQSRAILDYLQRPSLVSQAYVETRNGANNASAYLPNWPVTSVQQVVIDGRVLLPAPTQLGTPIGPGWVLDPWDGSGAGGPQAVKLLGGPTYCAGVGNVIIDYMAGYLVAGEAWVIPTTPYQVTSIQDLGPWKADSGVIGPNGAMVAVKTGPTTGQYSVDPATGIYTFAAADAGLAVAISYSYTPATLEDACISWVSERWKYRGRMGIRSKAIGDGQTESYDLSDVPAYIKTQLSQYRKLLPI